MIVMEVVMKIVWMVYVDHRMVVLFMISIIAAICSVVGLQVFVMEAQLVVSSTIHEPIVGLGIVLAQIVV